MNIFGFILDIWGGGDHHKIGLYSWVISVHFRVFSLGQCTEWGIFFGLLEIPDIYFGE